MKKMLGETLLGLILLGSGLYVGYIYLNGLSQSNMFWLLIISILLITGSVYFLSKAGKMDNMIVAKMDEKKLKENSDSQQSVLERNNEMTAQYMQTEEDRNKLKLLQAAAEDEK